MFLIFDYKNIGHHHAKFQKNRRIFNISISWTFAEKYKYPPVSMDVELV